MKTYKNFIKTQNKKNQNVLAQNINMVKQGFDFNVFNPKKRRKSTKKNYQ